LIAAGFFFLIRFEIQYGVAGGKFGGVELSEMPGTFWFFISLHVLFGLYLVKEAIKELWNLFHRSIEKNDQKKPANIIAVYWLLATVLFLTINLLAIWSAFEMLFYMYKLLREFEMPRKLILGGLFLMSVGVFCYLYYVFLFRSLIETFFPKARISFQSLQKKSK